MSYYSTTAHNTTLQGYGPTLLLEANIVYLSEIFVTLVENKNLSIFDAMCDLPLDHVNSPPFWGGSTSSKSWMKKSTILLDYLQLLLLSCVYLVTLKLSHITQDPFLFLLFLLVYPYLLPTFLVIWCMNSSSSFFFFWN